MHEQPEARAYPGLVRPGNPGENGWSYTFSVRPIYREIHQVRASMVLAGSAGAAVWFLVWLLAFARSAPSFTWVTLIASIIASVAAALLFRYGDRGVATGVAGVTGACLAIAGLVVELHYVMSGSWIMWLHIFIETFVGKNLCGVPRGNI